MVLSLMINLLVILRWMGLCIMRGQLLIVANTMKLLQLVLLVTMKKMWLSKFITFLVLLLMPIKSYQRLRLLIFWKMSPPLRTSTKMLSWVKKKNTKFWLIVKQLYKVMLKSSINWCTITISQLLNGCFMFLVCYYLCRILRTVKETRLMMD